MGYSKVTSKREEKDQCERANPNFTEHVTKPARLQRDWCNEMLDLAIKRSSLNFVNEVSEDAQEQGGQSIQRLQQPEEQAGEETHTARGGFVYRVR